MRLATREGNRWTEEQAFRWFRLRKRLWQFLRYRKGAGKDVLFIVGAQRSGTSMIHHLFRLDWNAVTYDEWSALSLGTGDEPLRWKPLGEVRRRILADRSPFVACKPLVESQKLVPLLEAFPEARAIWMYRDFRDVVSSSLRYFGPDVGRRDLAPILAGDRENWRAENLADEARDTIRRLWNEGRSGHDAAALFWYARNSLYASLGLAEVSRVVLCRYEDLVTEPAAIMRSAYGFLGRPYPGDRILGDVRGGSKGKGAHVELAPPIADACEDMLGRLDAGPRLGKIPA